MTPTPTTPIAEGRALVERRQGGTFACPICGDSKPHYHTAPIVNAYQNKRSWK